MALNTQNTDAISFKKLGGKAHTQQNFAISEEGISSNIQISYTTVFGDTIDSLPVTNGGLSSLYDNDAVVERIKFEIDIIPDTEILVGRSQGYRLKLPADYDANGYLFPSFSAGTYLHESLGKLQIVPALYGSLKPDGSTEYDPVLYETDGSTQISKFDSINWYLDTYSGILFVQDPPSGYNTSASRPGYVEAYLYVGRYVNDALGSSNNYWKSSGVTVVSSGATISGATVKFSNSLEYLTDLSSGFTKHSIADVNFVTGLTSQITSGFTQAGNGITVDGSVVSLGGGLSGDTIFIDTRSSKKGLEYGGDYSSDFLKHSIVDVNFVTGITSQIVASSGITLATNGLSKEEGYIKLGGSPLTEETSIDGNAQKFALTDTSKISFTANNPLTSESVGISINPTGFTITDTRTGATGIQYGGDYSSGFTKHSLVDVNFVTGATSGGFTADNGLTKTGINVSLGGELEIESTVIEGTGDNDTDYRELYLGSSSKPIGYLEANTDYGTYFNDLNGGGFHVETYEGGTIDFEAFGGSGVVLISRFNNDNSSNQVELNVDYEGLYARNTNNVTSGITTALLVSRELYAGVGGPVAGFGVKLNFELTNSLRHVPNAEAGISYIWIDPTEGSEDGKYQFSVQKAGLEKTIIEIDGDSVKYPSNFSSGFTKFSLVDVNYVTGITSTIGNSGNFWKTSGTTTLSGLTTIDSGTNALQLKTSSSPRYSILQFNQHQAILASSNGGSIVNGLIANSGATSLRYNHSVSTTTSTITMSNGSILITDGINTAGMAYSGDYTVSGSSLYGPYWIPNKGYVDTAIASAISSGNSGNYWKTSGTTSLNGDVIISGGTARFKPTSGYAGVSVGEVASDPTSRNVGDMWVNSSSQRLKHQSGTNAIRTILHMSDSDVVVNRIPIMAGTDARITTTGILSFTSNTLNVPKISLTGATYTGDYSSAFTKHSLVDVNYVTGNTITASNGLTKSGNTIILGGDELVYDATNKRLGIGADPLGDVPAVGFDLYNGSGVRIRNGVSYLNLLSSAGNLWDIDVTHPEPPATDAVTIRFLKRTITSGLAGVAVGRADGTSNNSNFIAANGNSYFNLFTGNVGIGTSNPTTKLSISGGSASYGGDYSSGFTKYSLVDVNYVTGITSTLTGGTGGSIEVGNGLTKQGSVVVLGGSLTGSTTIDANGNDLTIQGFDGGLYIKDTTGGGTFITDSGAGGMYFTTNGGFSLDSTDGGGISLNDSDEGGIYVQGDGDIEFTTTDSGDGTSLDLYMGYGLGQFTKSTPSTNNVETILIVKRGVIGSAANGVGAGLEFATPNEFGAYLSGSSISYVASDISNTSYTGHFEFAVHSSGTSNKILEIHGSGATYNGDFSSGFTKHSIVDVNYVTGITSTLTGGSTSINGINITGGSYTATTTTDFVGISGESAVTVYLPIVPTSYEKIIIADIKGNALSANITINGNGKLINGSSTALINTNYGAVTLIYHGVNWTVVSFA